MASAAVNRRAIAIVVALILAGIATVAVLSYVRGVENQALAQAQPVQAFIAKDTIEAGTPAEVAISNGLIAKTAVPRKTLAEGAITSLDQIEGRVATVNILKGEQIVAPRFGAQQEATTDLAKIPDGRHAISVDVAIVPGVAGRVNPGDRVSVLAQIEQAAAGAEAEPLVKFLVQDAEVLAIGQRERFVTEEGRQGTRVQYPEGRVVATLAVTPADAEKLTFAIFQGQLYFTLLPEGEQQPATTPGRTRANLFE